MCTGAIIPKPKTPAAAPQPDPVKKVDPPILSNPKDSDSSSVNKSLKRFQIDVGSAAGGSGLNVPQ